MRWIALFLLGACITCAAQTYPDPTFAPGTGGSSPRSMSKHFGDVVNVADFGAKCDGSTDDAAAINSAFSYVRNSRTIGGVLVSRIVFPQGNCVVLSTINATQLVSKSLVIDGYGANITGKTSGTPVIDALGSQYLKFVGLAVIGNSSSTPNIGIQIGRIDVTANNSADNIIMDGVSIQGSFTFAALYNLNAETSLFNHLVVVNSYASANSYGVVLDGLNHWNASSAFVTELQPVDTAESFNENVFINCDIRHNSTGVPVWMAMVTRHRWVSSYIAAVQGTIGAVLFSNSNFDSITQLDMDVHFETGTLQHVFFVTGPNTVPVFPGFSYRDQYPQATVDILSTDTNITLATLQDGNIHIAGLPNNVIVYGTPGVWRISGYFYVGGNSAATAWNIPTGSVRGGFVDINGNTKVFGVNFLVGGSKFTTTGTCTTPASTSGGGSVGSWTNAASGTVSNCTVIVAINGPAGASTANGWSCWVNDLTKNSTPGTYVAETASTSSTVTFQLGASTAASDVFNFGCMAY